MKKGKKAGKTNLIGVFCGITGIMMALLVVGSMFYFRYKMEETSEIIEALDYHTYDKYYVLITDDRNSSFWQSVYAGARKRAAAGGAYVEMLGMDLSVDYDKMDLMQIAIDSKVDGIIVEADESYRMTQLIQRAGEAGIPVVTALGDNTDSGRNSFVGVSNYNLGLEYGGQVCEIVSKKQNGEVIGGQNAETGQTAASQAAADGQTAADSQAASDSQAAENRTDRRTEKYRVLLLLDAGKTDSSQNIILSGLQEAVSVHGMEDSISVETALVDSSSAFAAEEAIRDIFMTYYRLPDIIVCLNEQNTTCVYQTVVDYNKVGQVEIVGYYESDTIRNAIRKNIIYSTISIDTEQMGQYCADALEEYGQSGFVSDYFGVDVSLINADSLAASEEGGADEETE